MLVTKLQVICTSTQWKEHYLQGWNQAAKVIVKWISCFNGSSICSTEKDDLDMTKYGYLQIVAIGSKGSSGVFLVSSFCEQINSEANLAVTDRTSLLSHKEINIFVTLLMNKFMDTWSSSSNMTSRDNQLTLPNLKDDTDIIQTLEWMINSIIQNTIIQLM